MVVRQRRTRNDAPKPMATPRSIIGKATTAIFKTLSPDFWIARNAKKLHLGQNAATITKHEILSGQKLIKC
jgi:hypothetical protein